MKGWVDKLVKNRKLLVLLVVEVILVIASVWVYLPPQHRIKVDFYSAEGTDSRMQVVDGALLCNGENNSDSPDDASEVKYRLDNIKTGKYRVKINYSCDTASDRITNGFVSTASSYSNGYEGNKSSIYMFTTLNTADAEIWVESNLPRTDLDIGVTFYHDGSLKIESIELSEVYVYSVLRFLTVILAVLVVNVLVYIFRNGNQDRRICVAAVIFGTAVSSALLFCGGLPYGHDTAFHSARIASIIDGIKAGNFNVHIQSEAFSGYGYATPLFYGQIFLYFPAILYMLGVPFYRCFNIYIIAVNLATAMVSCYSFKKIFKDTKIAAVGSIVYTLSIYRITNIYVRGAVGEYTAMIFLPLILYGVYRIYFESEKDKISVLTLLPLILGAAGLIQSHIITTQIAVICLVIFGLANYRKTFTKRTIMTLVKAGVIIVILNLAFIVPFIDSYSMELNVFFDNKYIQYSGARLFQIFSVFFTSGGSCLPGVKSDLPMCIGLSSLFCLIYYFYRMYYCRQQDSLAQLRAFGNNMFVLAIIAIAFSTVYFPWDIVRYALGFLGRQLTVIQFSWRYLSVACAFIAVLLCCIIAFYNNEKRIKAYLFAGGMILLNLIGISMFYRDYSNSTDFYQYYSAAEVDRNNIGLGEYLLAGTNTDICADSNPSCEAYDVKLSGYTRRGSNSEFYCENNGQNSEIVNLPLWAYDNYYAYNKRTGEKLYTDRAVNNRLTVEVPENYADVISVRYVEPWYWKLAYAVNVAGILLIVVICMVDNKRKKAD